MVHPNLLLRVKPQSLTRNVHRCHSCPILFTVVATARCFRSTMSCTYVNVDKSVLYVSAHEQYVDLLRHRRTERCTDCIQSQPMFWSSINMAARAACKCVRSPSPAPCLPNWRCRTVLRPETFSIVLVVCTIVRLDRGRRCS